MLQLYGYWCHLLLWSERVGVKEESMNTYQRVKRSQDWFSQLCGCMCDPLCGCLYVCMPVAVAGVGYTEKAFAPHLQNSSLVLCSRTLQMMAMPGAARVAEKSHTASKKRDTTSGQSIWSKHASPPPTNHCKKKMGWVGGWLLYSPLSYCCEQESSEEVSITTCHAALTPCSVHLCLSSWELSSRKQQNKSKKKHISIKLKSKCSQWYVSSLNLWENCRTSRCNGGKSRAIQPSNRLLKQNILTLLANHHGLQIIKGCL